MIKHIKNKYMTNDDDLEIATDGYKSKEKVCAFYTNRGHCYKGAYCEDKHTLPREGAVTADQEEVIITTVNVMRMPGVGSTVSCHWACLVEVLTTRLSRIIPPPLYLKLILPDSD